MRDRNLYRIITGRLQFSKGDLSLYIEDPGPQLVHESYKIYDEVYDDALRSNMYLRSQIFNVLIERNMWTPLDDREADRIEKEIRNLKVQAYENHYKKKKLKGIKRVIRKLEEKVDTLRGKKYQLNRETCEGLAEEERRLWLITESVYYDDGTKYDFEDEVSEDDVIAWSLTNSLSQKEIRDIAKHEPWRTMWLTSTKTGELFNKPSTDFTEYQLALCQYSIMYDNVHHSMEAPEDDVILDDDCLDGWFIAQKRELDDKKKKKSNEKLFRNPKIANAQELIVMVDDVEDARRVMDMNDARGKQIIHDRARVIDEKGRAKQGDFQDVQERVMMEANKASIEARRNRRK